MDTPDTTQSHAINKKTDAADAVLSGEHKPSTSAPPTHTDSMSGDNAGPKPLGGTHSGSHTSHSQKDDLGSVSTETGTGEIYIKSTGTAADGGDFDAARAGAGREADRGFPLMISILMISRILTVICVRVYRSSRTKRYRS